MERSLTHHEEDFEYKELESLSLGLEKDEEEIKIDTETTENKEFNKLVDICRDLHDRINENNIDDLRKHFQSNGMKMEVMRLHDYYRQHIKDLDNSNIVKQEIDCVLDWLGISFYNLEFDEFKM